MMKRSILSAGTRRTAGSRILMAGIGLLALSSAAFGTTFDFNTDPFQGGADVRNIPGRQIVGGEAFISFNPAHDVFTFDANVFGVGNQIEFDNSLAGTIPNSGVDVVVLESLDDDNNPLTPFGAGNAANLIADRITDPGPGFFVYFNQSLDLPRLVYSTDLSSDTADLRILARMLNLNGSAGINALPTFTAANFAIDSPAASNAPEPSGLLLMSAGLIFFTCGGISRRFRAARTTASA